MYNLFIETGNCAQCMACLVNTLGKLAGDFIGIGGSHHEKEDSDKNHEKIAEDISGGKSKGQENYDQNYSGENASQEKMSKINPKKESIEYVHISSDEENESVYHDGIDPGYNVEHTLTHRSGSCASELQLKVNCRMKVNCRIKFVLA